MSKNNQNKESEKVSKEEQVEIDRLKESLGRRYGIQNPVDFEGFVNSIKNYNKGNFMNKSQEIIEKVNTLHSFGEESIDSEVMAEEIESTYGYVVASGFDNVVDSIKATAIEAKRMRNG